MSNNTQTSIMDFLHVFDSPEKAGQGVNFFGANIIHQIFIIYKNYNVAYLFIILI